MFSLILLADMFLESQLLIKILFILQLQFGFAFCFPSTGSKKTEKVLKTKNYGIIICICINMKTVIKDFNIVRIYEYCGITYCRCYLKN